MIGLAIGATTGHWLVAFGIFVLATLVAIHGLATGAQSPERRHGGALAISRSHSGGLRRLSVVSAR